MNKKLKIAISLFVLSVALSFSAIYASAETDIPLENDTMLRIGKLYNTSFDNCLEFSDGLDSTGNLGIHFYTEYNNNNYSILTTKLPVCVTRDKEAKLASSGRSYVQSASGSLYYPYSIMTTQSYSFDTYSAEAGKLEAKIKEDVYPIVSGKNVYLGIGSFASEQAAGDNLAALTQASGIELNVYTPNDSFIAVTERSTGKPLLKIKTSSSQGLLAYPVQPTEGSQSFFLNNSASFYYEGAFEYKASSEGLALVNIVGLEAYVRGVIPYEISTSWPDEAIKAFAVAVRTYTVRNIGKHTDYGFDLCDCTDCQVYWGLKRSTDRSNELVAQTAGEIATYDGKIINAVYFDNGGGSTDDVSSIWGSNQASYPYLTGVNIPEEMFASYTNKEFSNIVTKSELSSYLMSRTAVNSKLSGTITDIKVTERSRGNYAYKVKLTLSNGNSYTFQNGSTVKGLVAKYTNSPKFFIGYPIYSTLNNGSTNEKLNSAEVRIVSSNNNVVTCKYMDDLNGLNTSVLTADGLKGLTYDNGSYMISGKGWGHGVGLTQQGANALAKLGVKYQDILKRFYTGISIVQYSTVK